MTPWDVKKIGDDRYHATGLLLDEEVDGATPKSKPCVPSCLKSDARVRQTARYIRIHLATGWPFQDLFRSVDLAVNQQLTHYLLRT